MNWGLIALVLATGCVCWMLGWHCGFTAAEKIWKACALEVGAMWKKGYAELLEGRFK